jgi:hypothetical protein
LFYIKVRKEDKLKKILSLFIILLVFFVADVSAQKYVLSYDSSVSTLAGADTLTFTSPAIEKYSGVVAFDYSITNTADSCNALIMQGSFDGSTWSTVDQPTAKATAETLIDETPAYLYYRLFMSTASGDTVVVNSVQFVYKEE